MITSCQIRAARAFLNWSAQQLADQTGLGVATIRRMELSNGVPSSNAQNLALVKSCFEVKGIEFLGGPEDAPGLRLRKP